MEGGRPYTARMVAQVHAPALLPALATGVGSLPHTDAEAASRFVLEALPRLPVAPQLPNRDARERMIAQALVALPEISVDHDGDIELLGTSDAAPEATFDDDHHGGLLTFLDVAAEQADAVHRVKVQCAGPLTLGIALTDAGMSPERAFDRAADLSRAWIAAHEALLDDRLPGAAPVLFLDEPGLVSWRHDEGPIDRDRAVDVLSGVLSTMTATSGVHVCGDGDRRLALEAGPVVVGFDTEVDLVPDSDALARYLDGEGWIAWGVVPTDRPVGSASEPHWRSLTDTWCELTRRGCDPARLRTQSLLTPSCGLVGHSEEQARRLLELTNAIADRVHDQAVATRLNLGA